MYWLNAVNFLNVILKSCRNSHKLSPPQCFMCRGGRVLYLSALQMNFAVKSIRPQQESCREVAEGLFRFAQSK